MNDDTRLLISRLAATSEWDALETHLNEQRANLINRVITGHLDHADYLRACGEIKGIDAVLTAPRIPAPKRPATSTR